MSEEQVTRIAGRDVLIGLAGAGVIWTAAFRGKSRFWPKMAAGIGSLGAYALYANPDLRKARMRPTDVARGIASAGALYGIFQAGDRFARKVMPNGGAEIDDIYRKRGLAPDRFIAATLVLLIAPGEELFWRGLVNRYLAQRLGPVAGNAAGATIYGAIHLVSGNLTLTGAAGVAGAFWSLEQLAQGRMAPLIVSHIAWDVWIFLVRPTA
ncbi:MAG: CPBP family intramembrane glutamic endopeptidase [Candidatus Dormibacter sp.]